MSKLFYRGFEAAANDNAPVATEKHNLVYRGVNYAPAEKKAKDSSKAKRLMYRGAAA